MIAFRTFKYIEILEFFKRGIFSTNKIYEEFVFEY